MTVDFQKPTPVETVFNRLFGWIVKLGCGLKHNQVLQVRGRKSGALHETPVNLLELEGAQYLVAPRGHTEWVKNVAVNPEVVLRRGRRSARYRVKPVPPADSAPILREYLERYHPTVQRYFTVPRGAELAQFTAVAERHPVFVLERLDA
jgi:deazaflavin-dependent oxidoreductase (nitroreductase family)